MQADLLILNAAQVVTCASPSPKRREAMRDVGIITDGALAVRGEEIVAVGKSADLAAQVTAGQTIDAGGKVVCPGFVDPHTHVVYAGDRVDEFEMRIGGASYMEIMAAGGGINNTTRATRAATLDQLIDQTRGRIDWMLQLGTTTAEVKSGYGLDTETELKILEAVARLDQSHPIDLIPTFMGAHALPPEYKSRPEEYVSLVIEEMIPAVAAWYRASHFPAKGVPLFVDVFCEENAFSVAQSRRVLEAGAAHGMSIKAHVDEFNSLGGVSMALELKAVSIDHLDAAVPEDIQRVAESQTVAVVIPAVNFNLGSTDFANARGLIDAGAALALTTDINPGSAPCPSMPLVMAIACRYQKLLPAEAMNAATINAAHGISQGHCLGSLEVGKQADILILNTHDYRHLAYHLGNNHVETVIKRGRVV
jgi:imidazolonepropionase